MSKEDALLFIDSNQYLDLYRLNKGKRLLAQLGEQADYIFVTKQVGAEVERNKLKIAAVYLSEKCLKKFELPDHLSGTGTAAHVKDIPRQMTDIRREVDAFVLGIIGQISRSEDEVSRALAPIFAKAVSHSAEELSRARDRRELGNPPGKSTNFLGDQLNWEQILTRLRAVQHQRSKRAGRNTKLWIIARDGDYGTVYRGESFLNPFLRGELSRLTPAPEPHFFTEMGKGIEHFIKTTGVRAEQRLTGGNGRKVSQGNGQKVNHPSRG